MEGYPARGLDRDIYFTRGDVKRNIKQNIEIKRSFKQDIEIKRNIKQDTV
jgi:hypothetical protein